jgi:hypothetical protein
MLVLVQVSSINTSRAGPNIALLPHPAPARAGGFRALLLRSFACSTINARASAGVKARPLADRTKVDRHRADLGTVVRAYGLCSHPALDVLFQRRVTERRQFTPKFKLRRCGSQSEASRTRRPLHRRTVFHAKACLAVRTQLKARRAETIARFLAPQSFLPKIGRCGRITADLAYRFVIDPGKTALDCTQSLLARAILFLIKQTPERRAGTTAKTAKQTRKSAKQCG